MIRKMIMHMGRIQTKRGIGCWQVGFVSCCKIANRFLGAGGAATGKFCNLYPHFYFQILTDAKLLPKLQYKHFCLKTGNLIINWLLLSYATCHAERLSSMFYKNMKARGLQKSQFLNILLNWEKFDSAA